jgi:hypothetical protein
MTKTIAAAMLAMTVPALTHAQAPQPRLLSPHTAPESAGSADHGVAKAAGMPLRDGNLAPGVLTVRIVRGSFDNNVPGQDVTVAVAAGKSETVRTGPDGRAQFAHLPVGTSVRAAATVDGEVLRSDSFEMPVESGVRLLLVIGEGPVTAAGRPPGTATQAPPLLVGNAGTILASPSGVVPVEFATTTRGRSNGPTGVTVIRVIMTAATLLAFAVVLFRRPGAGQG